MQKVYQRINWENDPSTNTPINEDNLNKMDYAIDQIDERVVQLSGYQDRVEQSEANAKKHANDSKTYSEKAKESELNAKESELLAEQYAEQAFSGTPEGYSALVEQVEAIDIKTSNEYDLFGTKQGGYRLTDLVGATEQKQLSGKNLLNNSGLSEKTVNGVKFTPKYNSNGELEYIEANGTATGGTAYLSKSVSLKAGSYTVNGCPSGGSSNKYNQFVQISGGSTLGTDIGNGVTFTLTEDATVIVYSPRVVSGTTVTGLKFYPMLTLASETDQTYEPYCGGTPSPNPEFPQVIENYADCVEMMQGGWDVNTGAYLSSNNYVCCKHPIPCKQGDVIDIEYDGVVTVIRALYYNNGTFVSSKSIGESKFNATVPDGVNNFKFIINNSNGLPIDSIGKITLTVNGKHVGQIVEHNDNLFVKSEAIVGKGINPSGAEYVADNMVCSDFFEVESGESYIGTKVAWWTFYTENRTFISQGSSTPKQAPSNAKYCRLSVLKTNIDVAQFEKGTVASEYKEGKRKVTTFYLTEPLRNTDRIVRVDGVWYEEHNRKTVVFDGSEDENWTYVEGSTVPYRIVINDMNTISSNITKLKCTHYQTVGVLDTWLNYDYLVSGYSIGGVVQSVVFRDISISTFDEFKAKLQASPITVEYELATPTHTPLDTASQLALNDMVTFDGATYIEVDSKVKPSGIRGEHGTSQVGAYTLKCMNDNDTDRVERAELKARLDELAVALVSQ